jgi:hypothetical protein
MFQKEAVEYQFAEVGSSKPIVVHEQAIFRWSNPARNGEDGAVLTGQPTRFRKSLVRALHLTTRTTSAINTGFMY